MRVQTIVTSFLALIAAGLLANALYEGSWIPDYGEAEPLYPIVAEFGRELVEQGGDSVSPADIKNLLLDERFEAIRKYGVVFSNNRETIFSIRVNKNYSFDVGLDGTAWRWE